MVGSVVALWVMGGAGCGDAVDEGAVESGVEDDDAISADDCADDEQFNPATGQCVDAGDDSVDDDDDDDDSSDDDNGDGDENGADECGPGSINGQTCRPDGGILPGADVVIAGEDCDGDEFAMSTEADGGGYYTFDDVPAGEHDLTITSGSFETTDEITVNADEETDLTSHAAKVCLDGDEAEIAVFEGMFDDVGTILDNMDIDHDAYSGGSTLGDSAHDLITDIEALLEYDILFIECQVDKPTGDDEALALENLQRFVEEGNSVYASDRAHPWIYMALPNAIDFALPDYDDDTLRSNIQTGSPSGSTGTYTADVVSDEMNTLLGADTVDFHFDTGAWTIVTGEGTASTPHFELNPDTWGSGDDIDNASVVTTYDDPVGNGRIIYTSFHNSAQDQIDGEMEEIMEYMIFQL